MAQPGDAAWNRDPSCTAQSKEEALLCMERFAEANGLDYETLEFIVLGQEETLSNKRARYQIYQCVAKELLKTVRTLRIKLCNNWQTLKECRL